MIPFNYDILNISRGLRPSASDMFYDARTFKYFERSLFQRVRSKFEVKTPDSWDKEIMMQFIICQGFIGVFDTSKYQKLNDNTDFGILPLQATLFGDGIQYQPTNIITENRYFRMPSEGELIYEGAGLIKLTPDYSGLIDIIDYFAEKLSVISGAIDQSIDNARHAYLIGANNKTAAEALEWMMDKRNSGKPWIIYNKELLKKFNSKDLGGDTEPFTFIDFEVGKNYITDKLLDDYRTLLNMFDTEIGIPNNPREDKKERLVSNEIESNSAETVARFTTWLNCLDESINKTIEVFPELEGKLSIKAKKYDVGQTGADIVRGGETDGTSETDSNRP